MIKTNSYAYDLEERTAKFGENIINFCKAMQHNVVTKPLISQLVRAGTSAGANYMEANQASSRKDFRNKIYICKKESNETKHWLRMISMAEADKTKECRELWSEAQELTLIFSKIISSLSQKQIEEV